MNALCFASTAPSCQTSVTIGSGDRLNHANVVKCNFFRNSVLARDTSSFHHYSNAYVQILEKLTCLCSWFWKMNRARQDFVERIPLSPISFGQPTDGVHVVVNLVPMANVWH
jgi:hypothetical protein